MSVRSVSSRRVTYITSRNFLLKSNSIDTTHTPPPPPPNDVISSDTTSSMKTNTTQANKSETSQTTTDASAGDDPAEEDAKLAASSAFIATDSHPLVQQRRPSPVSPSPTPALETPNDDTELVAKQLRIAASSYGAFDMYEKPEVAERKEEEEEPSFFGRICGCCYNFGLF